MHTDHTPELIWEIPSADLTEIIAEENNTLASTPEASKKSEEEESIPSVSAESETEKEEEKPFILAADSSPKEIVFEITPDVPAKEEIQEPVLKKREEPVADASKTEDMEAKKQDELKKVEEEEQKRKAYERILRLKELSLKLKTPNGLTELEQEPAFVRRKISLDNTPHSSESQVSKYTLTENEDKKIEIKPNNSFLHDNVD
ncbi:MAG TPA: hypothetical protein VGO45_07095, partial [Bacteroidia bacterium]|nr:hypothetical protein [Bacteroidia bacterium]